MTAETPDLTVHPAGASLWRWLPVLAVGALVLAVAAGIYRHEERDGARRQHARNVVVTQETRALDQKVAAARVDLAATRRRLRAQVPSSATVLKVLDRLKTNHASMSSIVHDQDVSSAGIVDSLASRRYGAYNIIVDRFTTASRTVDALASTETNLRDALVRSMCAGSCGVQEAAARLPVSSRSASCVGDRARGSARSGRPRGPGRFLGCPPVGGAS